MAKRPTLSAAMKRANRTETEPPAAEEARAVRGMPPSRQGKKAVTGHFDPAVSRLLRTIALEEETSVQALLGEAINDLLAKRGRPPVA